MKRRYLNIFRLMAIMLAFSALLSSCSEEFTQRDPEDAITADTYYENDSQVIGATSGMYCRTWFQFSNKFFWAVAEVGSGNMYTASGDVNAMRTFAMNGSDPELVNGWRSLWANVQQANFLINSLESRVSPSVSPAVVRNTLGEAYFFRATAYFYLVRLWGAVPIIENPLDYIDNPAIPTNRIEDVYTLIERDYNMAIEKLNAKTRGSNYADNGRVSKGSAKAMLAKVYLYNKNYAAAKQMAEEVINSNEFKLLGGSQLPAKSFGDLFTFPNNNNEESIFAIQWIADGNYGSANNCNTQFGMSTANLTTSNASYGGVFGPSQDVLTLFEDGDKRKHETIMFPGDTYPDMKVLTNSGKDAQIGFTVPAADQIGGQGAGAAIKKYCIGIVNGNATGPIDGWNMMENNTYIMRYAELLLIHAEATMAGSGSTSDAAALASFNAVRNRAGLSNLTTVTFDNVFLERRRELCFEGDFWFDLGRLPRAQATAIITAQNRGNMNLEEHFTPAESDFYLDYPDNDVAKNPLLKQPPVPYQFN